MADEGERAAELYTQAQEAILELVTEDNERLPVPACPGWELRDIVAHQTGALIDLITGSTRGFPSPAWAAGHVERFSARDLFEIRDLWRDAVRFESAALFRERGLDMLPDIVTHELDVRSTLHDDSARDEERVRVAFDVIVGWLDRAWRKAGRPALRFETESRSGVAGEGEPRATLRGSTFELSRVLTGRRSDAQMRALDWSADPSPWLDHLSVLGRRDTDLLE